MLKEIVAGLLSRKLGGHGSGYGYGHKPWKKYKKKDWRYDRHYGGGYDPRQHGGSFGPPGYGPGPHYGHGSYGSPYHGKRDWKSLLMQAAMAFFQRRR